ncbi:type IX secretion system sortase PorU [Roseivirga sp. E12]|uniref:type IX secretion system sortase PorU n=1 Tax=Roseivirga sp. E12 TaxID=2819237 RepID=UPI001ABC02D8|nr:type IX secretion system sortase PorU [Roseivirga sp. E12]MBO3700823.1 type IX secretion system sortase PorU [Roseivirga sp. E12]
MSSGKWVKMEFESAGVYKIDHNTLNEMGFVPAQLDPRNIAIYGNPGGMLPQDLSISRPSSLTENAIQVVGEDDGIFNESDFILFYVDEIETIGFDSSTERFNVTKNLYSDKNYYFITVKETNGKRQSTIDNLGLNHPKVDWYNQLVFHEVDEVNLLTSGREWLGEQFSTQNIISFNHENLSLAPNQEINLSVNVLAQSFSSSSMNIELNSTLLGELNFGAIPNTQYGIKGNSRTGDYQLSTNAISGSDLTLRFTYDQSGASNAVAYLDNYLLNLPSPLTYNGNPIHIRNTTSLNQAITTYEISGTSGNLSVWKVTDPTETQAQNVSFDNGTTSFGAFSNILEEFIIFDPLSLPTPEIFEAVTNQNLRGELSSDFIIITHPDFLNQAERLANFRRSNDLMNVLVTTIDKVYNEFSSGRQDVTALRDFIKWQYDLGDLKYVLLFGKGSYDYLERLENNTNFVPTYESRNSIHPLLTYSSDDYFGFLDNDEGEWLESSTGDHQLDIGIGRIPATSNAQAKRAIDKIILYQTDERAFGDWRSKLVFIADDGDNNRHQKDADSLTELIDSTFVEFNVEKIYLDAYEQIRLPNGETSPSAEEAIIDAVNSGALIVNFTGHGSETGWMQEQVLTFDLMEEWRNTFSLPFVVTATCEFGRNDDPSTFSGAENLIFKDVGGAVAMVTTARPVFSSTNFELNTALYGSVLNREAGQYQRLGDIIKFTKNNSLRGSLNRNFILLGDPSMRLSYPNKSIEIEDINGVQPDVGDTISALERVVINGRVVEGSNVDANFNGTLKFSLFDKLSDKQTLGSDGDPFSYLERDNELFRGSGKIENGIFQLEFIVPKNIDYSFGNGKMTMYAFDNSSQVDALGTSIDFVIGGTAEDIPTDNTPPSIDLFVNDTTEIIQQEYSPNVNLILRLFDESGINISNNGLGQHINLSINDSINYNLNKLYNADLDDFRHGELTFEANDLMPGLNRIDIKAWDTHGNSTTISQDLFIGKNSSNITVINNNPNPFREETHFSIQHLLSGENLEVGIEIRNTNGEPVTALFNEILRADETIAVPWSGTNNNGQKLNPGIYIYTIKIYSKTSGKSGVKRQKLIISN